MLWLTPRFIYWNAFEPLGKHHPSYFTNDTYPINSKSIKRFIYMSSAQALLGKPLGHVYREVRFSHQIHSQL